MSDKVSPVAYLPAKKRADRRVVVPRCFIFSENWAL